MGTRNLTTIINHYGEVAVAQYGQWDGYPSYSGIRLLEFISDYNMLNKLADSLIKCRFVEQEEIDAAYAVYNDSPKWKDYRNKPSGFSTAYPSLSRDTGVDIVKTIVYSNEEVILWNDSEFAQDTLFCEGQYIIDFYLQQFTTIYDGKTVTYSLDKLPTPDEYLAQFEVLTTEA